MITLYSWNVNGIRAAYSKGFLNWLYQTQPDILCLQEEVLAISVNPNFAITLSQDGTQLYSATQQVDGVGIYALDDEALQELAETRVTRWFTAEEGQKF
jgi:exodeoxyribonuclease-3